MSSIIEECQDEYNQVTYEILDRIDNLRNKTKESMMVGELNILKGIDIFEEAVKAINPIMLDDEAIYLIKRCINIALFKEEEKNGRVNNHIHYGVNSCYMMLDFYNKSKKRTLIKQ